MRACVGGWDLNSTWVSFDPLPLPLPLLCLIRAIAPYSVKELLERGANPDRAEAAHAAAAYGHEDILHLLLGWGAGVNFKDAKGSTPLAWAVRMDQSGTAQVLLAMGAAQARCDAQGRIAKEIASARGSEGVLAMLEEYEHAKLAETPAGEGEGRRDRFEGTACGASSNNVKEEVADVTLENTNISIFMAALNIYEDYDELFEQEGIRCVRALRREGRGVGGGGDFP